MISMISTPNVTHVTHFQVRLRARTYGGYTAQTSHVTACRAVLPRMRYLPGRSRPPPGGLYRQTSKHRRCRMTAVAITPASGGRHSVRFAYDSAIVSLIKSTIPAYARSWSAHTRCWFIDADWTPLLAAELRYHGHTVTGPADPAQQQCTDWAKALFRAVGPQRTPAVYRALSKVLHPDAPTGCPILQQQLNAARTALTNPA